MIKLGSVGSLDFVGGKVVVDLGYNDPNYGGAKLEVDLDVLDVLAHISAGATNSVEKAVLDGAIAIIKGMSAAPVA